MKELTEALKNTGIKDGDSIFVHSDLRFFNEFFTTKDEFLKGIVTVLKNAVGSGNVIMPTFTYSFCRGEVFNPETTPSKVGVLTEYFRKLPDVKRSEEGIFSVAAFGPDKDYFTRVGTNCFGKDSIFEKLYDRDAKIVFIGPRFDITYMHFVEQGYGVPYRWIKQFKGKIRDKEYTFSYNVGPLDKNFNYDLEKIARYLDSTGVLNEAPLGPSKIRVINAVDTYDALMEGFKKDVYFLLEEAYERVEV